MADIVLETRGVTMRFGGVNAVDGVDFFLRRDELRCLIGPNGAGKSTFFKCLAGMLTPSAGEILIDGQETTGWHPHEIARLGIGIKTQVPSVMDGLSVRENIWLAALRVLGRQGADGAVADALERLDLGDLAARPVGQLAHGERQRVELGIVIAARPWLVLLDEPAAGMTADEIERLAAVIAEIGRQAAIIIVEHDMQFIRAIARTVTVFAQGRILMEDHVDAVMADPRVRDIYLGKKG
ncbi:ATP-binding cassette domain-containing protein [Nitratireductor sp. CAU 1489]|uniref:ATP-binding cassette domain-containing protein n=1 Tax=Nitratireductor arenosus TaxID=2682096 RepID=A0A844QIT6_9HYPH|nr:ABC transporter ATP-binding protein [Nitratireductor arenosus]MVA99816.1 ATP-binding cassette domain-containing protein [Nitratireductor arenosus]